ncbi:MAG: ABC transporter permease [Candidatus Odinarchaeota archaeon]
MVTVEDTVLDQKLYLRKKYPPQRMVLIVAGIILLAFVILELILLALDALDAFLLFGISGALEEFSAYDYSSLGLFLGGSAVCLYMQQNMTELNFILRKLQESPLVVLGFAIMVSFIGLALAAPAITTFGAEERIWGEAEMHPNLKHLFGTDKRGGDTFSRCIWALQVDLQVAFFVVIIAAIVGLILGGIAGYYGGVIDEIIMRVTDIFLAFPGLILAMAIAAVLGRSMINLAWALVLVWWTPYVRLIRAQVLIEREKPYIEAAKSVGASDKRIIARHLLPNSIFPLLVQATLDLGGVILSIAALSFLGFGPPPGYPELGMMIAEGRDSLWNFPEMVLFPGMFVLIVCLGFNLVGDGLRDVLDPRLRR